MKRTIVVLASIVALTLGACGGDDNDGNGDGGSCKDRTVAFTKIVEECPSMAGMAASLGSLSWCNTVYGNDLCVDTFDAFYACVLAQPKCTLETQDDWLGTFGTSCGEVPLCEQ